jgi:MoaA/NifB/PqqE/SkfB family radical SAM enzyme
VWDYNDITSLNIEASSLCNAQCLVCFRFEDRGSVKLNPEFTPMYLKFEDVKRWFPPEFLQQINFICFSGDYGDAMTSPDIVPILDYLTTSNPNATIAICTNGGMRNVEFWDEVGKIIQRNPESYVTFSVDGLEDTNHIYRRKVKWDKLMANVEAYIATGARAAWDFLIFDYNEHQVEEAKEFSKKIGFTDFFSKTPYGLEHHKLQAKDKEDNVLYEVGPASNQPNPDGVEPMYFKSASEMDYLKIKDGMETQYKDVVGNIKCFSARDGGSELRISAEGNVHPCTHIGSISRTSFKSNQFVRSQVNHYLHQQEISLHHRSLKEILEDNPFQWFEDSWTDKKCMYCWHVCGKNKEKDTRMGKIFGQGDYGKT